MKILLTGAQGFLGGRILDFLLKENYDLRVLVRRPAPELARRGVEVCRGDLRQPSQAILAAEGIEGIVHCAAKSGVWGSLNEFIEANALSTYNLLCAARRHGAKWFVHTSSPSVVHSGRPLEGIDESAPYGENPQHGYPYSKMLAEKMVLAADEPSFRTTALRPHLIWGPGDPHFLPRLTAKARAGRLWLLKSNALVDGTFIDNAALAHVLAVKKMISGNAAQIGGRAYFIAQGEPLTAADFIQKILDAASGPGQELKIRGLIPAGLGLMAGTLLEGIWRLFHLKNEPPLNRFLAEELSLPHWFSLEGARLDLGYEPVISMALGLEKIKNPGKPGL